MDDSIALEGPLDQIVDLLHPIISRTYEGTNERAYSVHLNPTRKNIGRLAVYQPDDFEGLVRIKLYELLPPTKENPKGDVTLKPIGVYQRTEDGSWATMIEGDTVFYSGSHEAHYFDRLVETMLRNKYKLITPNKTIKE